MMTDGTAIQHFRDGRDALVAERKQLDATIAEVDRVLRYLTGEVSLPETATHVTVADEQPNGSANALPSQHEPAWDSLIRQSPISDGYSAPSQMDQD